MRGWVVWAAIIGIVGIGAFIFRDRISGGAEDLQVGDCFDVPAAAAEISEVQHHPCNEAHTAEVIFVGNYPGSGDEFPGDAAFTAMAEEKCLPAFKAYTGNDYETDTVLDMGYFVPSVDSWKNHGDREVTCHLTRIDQAVMTSSMRVGADPSAAP